MKKRSSKPVYFHCSVESLDSRAMLSAMPFGSPAGLIESALHSAAAIGSSIAHNVGNFQVKGTTLVAQVTSADGTLNGFALYQSLTVNGVTQSKFIVDVKGAAAGQSLDISLGGVTIGTVSANATSTASVIYSSNPKGSQQPLPLNFPTTVATDTAVAIGAATGTLTTPTQCVKNALQGTFLTAQLSATDGSAGSVTAVYQQSSLKGTTVTRFLVNVSGAAANTAMDVVIAGSKVATITTDASGNATVLYSSKPTGLEQQLPAGFPTTLTSASKTSLSVGSFSGTLAAPVPVTNLSLLGANLSSTTDGTAAHILYATGTQGSTAVARMTVCVNGATPNSTLDVVLNGTKVGSVTVDARGRGSLTLDSTTAGSLLPTGLTAGATLSVGSLSGSLSKLPSFRPNPFSYVFPQFAHR